jgi:hypothetical protein
MSEPVDTLTVYARREPTTDSATLDMYKVQKNPSQHVLDYRERHHQDVVIYKDRRATVVFARFPWYYSNKPKKNQRFITINCSKWAVKWI